MCNKTDTGPYKTKSGIKRNTFKHIATGQLPAPIRITLISAIITLLCGTAVLASEVGYDENTEIVVTGTVKDTSAGTYGGMECFTLKSRSRLFTVITGPKWFIRQRGLLLKSGVEMQVVGSKFYGIDGRLYLVARSLKPVIAGHQVMLRDKDCKPLWRDSGVKSSSCMHINYHSKQSLIF